LIILGLFVVIRLWFKDFKFLTGFIIGRLSYSIKGLVPDLAGWLFIIGRRPLSVGDRIQIGSFARDIVDIRAFQFTLMEIGNWVDADQNTGRVIHIPNGLILREILANYSKGFYYIWNKIPVLVIFESNWQKTKKILQSIAEQDYKRLSKAAEKKIKEASKKYRILYSKLTPIVYTSVRESGVLLTI